MPGQTILATASLLLAAKIEQSIVPSFSITIGQLPSQLQKHISKKDLINVEFDIVQRLEFSVRAVCPVFMIERQIKLLGLQSKQTLIVPICEQILRMALLKVDLSLGVRKADLALAVLNLALNILVEPALCQAIKAEV